MDTIIDVEIEKAKNDIYYAVISLSPYKAKILLKEMAENMEKVYSEYSKTLEYNLLS